MRKDKIKYIILIASGLIFLMSAFLFAELSDEQIEIITQKIQKEDSTWTKEETLELLKSGDQTIAMNTKDNRVVRIHVMGDTILLNGKDITGNLGSKITYGDKSPIIETGDNNLVTTGDNSPIRQTINIYTIIASIAFPLSLIFNIYLFRKKIMCKD